MGPVKQLYPVPFSGGIDTKTDPAQIQPGKLADLQNGIFRQTGAVGRRWGYKQLGQSVIGQTTNISACAAVQPFNEELILFDGQSAYSYVQADSAWVNKGSVVSVIQSNQQIVAGNAQQLSPDFGSLGGIEVYAWEDSRGGIRYSIFDSAAGTGIVSDQPLFSGMSSTARAPKVIPFAAANCVLVFFDDGFGDIAFCKFFPSNPALKNTGADTLINGSIGGYLHTAQASPVFYDAALSGDGQSVHVIASVSGVVGVNKMFIAAIGPTFRALAGWPSAAQFIGFGTATGPIPNPMAICSDGIGTNMFVGYATPANGSTLYQVSTYTTATGGFGGTGKGILASAQAIQSLSLIYQNGTVYSLADGPAAASGYLAAQMFQRLYQANFSAQTLISIGSPSVNLSIFKTSVGLASKPFQYAGHIYLNVAFQSNLQSTYFTVDINGNVVGKVFAGLCGGLVASSDYTLPECPSISPGIFKYANLVKAAANTEAGSVVALLGVNTTKLDFFDSNQFLGASINGSLYIVGGVLQQYEGANFVELGFNIYPENIALATTGGGSQSAGVYNYCVTYEWNDNNDRTDISTPSVATSITLTAGQAVQITVPTLKLTKKNQVKIVIYRTAANGVDLFRVTSAIAPFYNDPTQDFLVFTDVLSDVSIQGNGAMYTQPLATGSNPIVPNSAPPACSLIATYATRLFIAGLDDPYTIWYSQQTLANSPMQFSSLLTLTTDPDGGPITALARMDANLFIFKSNAIFYITGQGPTPTGDSNDLGVPIAIPSGEVGCVSANSIVLTPVGLLFQSANGIYLLDRGLNVSYKGAPVEKFNNLTITSATLVPNQWVVFTTTTGIALVYDYYYDQWSTFTNHNAIDSALYLGSSDMFVFAQPNGQVFEQSQKNFSDAGQPIPFSLTTAPITFAGLQGYQRTYHAFLLGTYKGPHSLAVGAAYDYDQTFTNLAPIPVDQILGSSSFGSTSPFGADAVFGGMAQGQGVYQFRVDLLRKCQAVQLQITDSQAAPGNEGFSLSALTLVVGVKKGGNKVPAVKQIGAA
jgi:hypothetical protein